MAVHCHTRLGQSGQAAEALKEAGRMSTPELEAVRERLRRLLD